MQDIRYIYAYICYIICLCMRHNFLQRIISGANSYVRVCKVILLIMQGDGTQHYVHDEKS